jgi:hypothetical protein
MEKKMDIKSSLSNAPIAELRRTEEACVARIDSIKRKLHGGSKTVTRELQLEWEQKLNETRAQINAAGELPESVDSGVIINPGALVRERGKRRVMTVKGEAGLAAHGHRFGSSDVLMAHKVVCEWRTPKGALRSAAFLASTLEAATAKKA